MGPVKILAIILIVAGVLGLATEPSPIPRKRIRPTSDR